MGITYDDWYLPSRDELVKFYEVRDYLPGGYSASYYWSSSETEANYAWWLNTYPMYTDAVDKKWAYAIRPIRSF